MNSGGRTAYAMEKVKDSASGVVHNVSESIKTGMQALKDSVTREPFPGGSTQEEPAAVSDLSPVDTPYPGDDAILGISSGPDILGKDAPNIDDIIARSPYEPKDSTLFERAARLLTSPFSAHAMDTRNPGTGTARDSGQVGRHDKIWVESAADAVQTAATKIKETLLGGLTASEPAPAPEDIPPGMAGTLPEDIEYREAKEAESRRIVEARSRGEAPPRKVEEARPTDEEQGQRTLSHTFIETVTERLGIQSLLGHAPHPSDTDQEPYEKLRQDEKAMRQVQEAKERPKVIDSKELDLDSVPRRPVTKGTDQLESLPYDKTILGVPKAADRFVDKIPGINIKDSSHAPDNIDTVVGNVVGSSLAGVVAGKPMKPPDSHVSPQNPPTDANVFEEIEKRGLLNVVTDTARNVADHVKGLVTGESGPSFVGGPAPQAVSTPGIYDTKDITTNLLRANHRDDPREARIYEAEVKKVTPMASAQPDMESLETKAYQEVYPAVLGAGKPVTGAQPHGPPSPEERGDRPGASDEPSREAIYPQDSAGAGYMSTGTSSAKAAPALGDGSVKQVAQLFYSDGFDGSDAQPRSSGGLYGLLSRMWEVKAGGGEGEESATQEPDTQPDVQPKSSGPPRGGIIGSLTREKQGQQVYDYVKEQPWVKTTKDPITGREFVSGLNMDQGIGLFEDKDRNLANFAKRSVQPHQAMDSVEEGVKIATQLPERGQQMLDQYTEAAQGAVEYAQDKIGDLAGKMNNLVKSGFQDIESADKRYEEGMKQSQVEESVEKWTQDELNPASPPEWLAQRQQVIQKKLKGAETAQKEDSLVDKLLKPFVKHDVETGEERARALAESYNKYVDEKNAEGRPPDIKRDMQEKRYVMLSPEKERMHQLDPGARGREIYEPLKERAVKAGENAPIESQEYAVEYAEMRERQGRLLPAGIQGRAERVKEEGAEAARGVRPMEERMADMQKAPETVEKVEATASGLVEGIKETTGHLLDSAKGFVSSLLTAGTTPEERTSNEERRQQRDTGLEPAGIEVGAKDRMVGPDLGYGRQEGGAPETHGGEKQHAAAQVPPSDLLSSTAEIQAAKQQGRA